MNSSFSRGAGQGNFAATTPISVISASASAMPAAKSASLSPIVTSWPAPTSGARAAAASHIARENRNSGSSTGFWMWIRICAPACHGFATADKFRQ